MSKSMACLRGQLHSFSVLNPQNKQFYIPRQTWHWQRRIKCLRIHAVQLHITFWKVLDSLKTFVGVTKANLMWVVFTRCITTFICIYEMEALTVARDFPQSYTTISLLLSVSLIEHLKIYT